MSKRRTRQWFARDLFRSSRIVIVPARHWHPLATELGARRVCVVPHGIAAHLASELAKVGSRHAQRTKDRTVVLYYGRWAHVKGLDILGDAVRGLDAARQARLEVRIFGNGDRGWLEKCMEDVGDTDIYIGGWLPDHEKAKEMANAHAFVAPSRSELFGQTLLEAMAANKPIIASRVGGVPDVLEGYAKARLTPPESATALRGALRELLDGVWPDMPTESNQGLSDHYTASAVTKQIAEVYETAATSA